MPQLLQHEPVQEELTKYPFTPRPQSPVEPREPEPVRESVRYRLRATEWIPTRELDYLKEHPEDMEWLKRKVRPRFYANLLAQIEARPREDEEDQKREMEYRARYRDI